MPRNQWGTPQDDILFATEAQDRLQGLRGNDRLTVGDPGGGAWGGMGDDTLIGGGRGMLQSHLYGGVGADTIYLDISSPSAPYGDHVWGDQGPDSFIFIGREEGGARITGRIDDFDPSRDEILIDNQRLDFNNLPPGVRIVGLYSQPWLLIDERALFSLEGARKVEGLLATPPGSDAHGNANGEERHFIPWPEEWADGVPPEADIPFADYVSYFPRNEGPARDWEMETPHYTAASEAITGTAQAERLIGGDGSDTLDALGGDDLIHGGEGHDVIHGGAGNDSISGGLDNDLIYGGTGLDVIYGGSGHDTLHGGEGDDRISGNNGRDLIYGGAGDDRLFGGIGNDTLYGGAGNDELFASYLGEEAAPLTEREDQLYGGIGDDTLYGAPDGQATMSGGQGADRFVMNDSAQLTLSDFQVGEDFLDLTGMQLPSGELADHLEERTRPGEQVPQDLLLSLAGGASVLFEGLASVDRAALAASMSRLEVADPEAPP